MTNLRIVNLLPVIAALFVFQTVAVGQAQKGKEVFIQQKFEPGKKYKIEIQKNKTDSEIPELELSIFTTTAELSILSKKDSLRECSWRYGSTIATGTDPLTLDNRKLNQTNGLDIRFRVDEKGTFKEIINFDECRSFLNQSVWIANQNNNNIPKNQEEFKKMMDVWMPLYSTQELFIHNFCPEVNLFFNLFGKKLNTDSSYNKKSELPNPLGGSKFPTIVSTKVENVVGDRAKISEKHTIVQEKLAPILLESMKAIAAKNNVPFNESELPKFNLSVYTAYTFDVAKSAMTEVSTEKTTKINEKKTTEILKIVVK